MLLQILRHIRLIPILLLVIAGTHLEAQNISFDNVEMLKGRKKVNISFQYVHNFIILQVHIYDGIPVNLIFDTGAEHVIIFKREFTDILQVPYDKKIPILGSDLSREIYALITRNAMLQVEGLAPKPYDLLVLEEDYFNLDELVGMPIDGILGGGFFKNLIFQIDYRNQKMTIYDPDYFEAPEDYRVLPIRVKSNKPYVDAEASLQDGTVVRVDLLVDTGAGVPLLLHNNSHESLTLPPQYIRGKLGMGLGGYLEGFIGRIPKLSIGNVEFPGVLTSFQDINEEWLVDPEKFRNGILGNQLLSRFRVFFDYNKGQLIVKPYHARQKPFVMDRSGLVIFAYGVFFNQFIVKDIIPNSPAAEADIRPDDIILKIQGLPSHVFRLDGINSLLQKRPGKRISLFISRGGKTMKKVLYLRDLV